MGWDQLRTDSQLLLLRSLGLQHTAQQQGTCDYKLPHAANHASSEAPIPPQLPRAASGEAAAMKVGLGPAARIDAAGTQH